MSTPPPPPLSPSEGKKYIYCIQICTQTRGQTGFKDIFVGNSDFKKAFEPCHIKSVYKQPHKKGTCHI